MSTPSAEKPLSRRLLPLRIAVLTILLAGLGVVVFVELRARSHHGASVTAVGDELRSGADIDREELRGLLVGSYEVQRNGPFEEEFRWGGVLNWYEMRIRYDRDVPDIVAEMISE